MDLDARSIRLPISRTQAVRTSCAQLSATWPVEVWPCWWNASDRWEIDCAPAEYFAV